MASSDEVRLTVPIAPGFLGLCETAARRVAAVAELDEADGSALIDAVREAWMTAPETEGTRQLALTFRRRPNGVEVEAAYGDGDADP